MMKRTIHLGEVTEAVRLSVLHKIGLLLITLLLISTVFVAGHAIPFRMSQDLRIAVAEWRQEGSQKRDIQSSVYALAMERLSADDLEKVSIKKIPESLQNADDIDSLAEKYNADMILQGWYDDLTVWSYVDLANAADESGLTNSLDAFLKRGGSTKAIPVLKVLSEFEYEQEGVYFCVPRWTP